MRIPAIVLGILLLLAGGLISLGVFEFDRTEKVAEIGPVTITKTETERAPLNLGYVLLGVGAVILVIGLVARK